LEEVVGGVDEAGRGSLVGPLVVAGVSVQASKLHLLVEAGVKDSKLLSPSARSRLYELILAVAEKVHVVEVPPREVDKYVLHGKRLRRLNYLEVEAMAKVVSEIGVKVVYVDSPDVKPERFAENIRALLKSDVKVIAEHHADRRYPVVSAASVVAKVTRDRRIRELEQAYGEIGSGYPSDPRTRAFVRSWLESRGSPPDFVRVSWKTLKGLSSRSLDEFR